MFISIRTLTISSLFVRNIWSNNKKPKLTISGDWMTKAGFKIGESVKVEVFENRLIITKT